MAECPLVRQGWELRSAWSAERPKAPEGSECRQGPDRDAQAAVPEREHRAVGSEMVYRTCLASFSCSASAGTFMIWQRRN